MVLILDGNSEQRGGGGESKKLGGLQRPLCPLPEYAPDGNMSAIRNLTKYVLMANNFYKRKPAEEKLVPVRCCVL